MFTLKIQNANGELLEITHNHGNYIIENVQGLTLPNTVVNMSTSACDGGYFNHARVQARNLVINISIHGSVERNRQHLYRFFNLKRVCTIYFKNQYRNVKIFGYVEMFDGDLFSSQQQMQISIICPQPYWEDIETIYTELLAVTKNFEFPFNIIEPIEISTKVDTPICRVINNGDVECGCMITVEFLWYVSNLKIINITNQEFFGFSYQFGYGDKLIINTRKGEKSAIVIRNGEEINLLNNIVAGSTWLQINTGESEFTYTVNGENRHTNIVISMSALYGGV